jgi:tetratricopeptide (TPR) repeat protein
MTVGQIISVLLFLLGGYLLSIGSGIFRDWLKNKLPKFYYLFGGIATIAGGAILFYSTDQKKTEAPVISNIKTINPVFSLSDTHFKILVLPFDKEGTLEGKSYDIGAIVSRRLESINLEDSLNLVTYFLKDAIDLKNMNARIADSLMGYHHADQIIYGFYILDDCPANNSDKVCFNYRTHSTINLFRKQSKTDYNMMSFSDSSIRNGSGQEDIDFIIYSRAAVAAMFNKNFQRAIEQFKKIKNYLDYEEIGISVAECYEELNDLNEAKSVLETVTEKHSKSSLAWNNLGVIYSRLKRKKDSKRCYEIAIKENEGYGLAWFNLGNYYYILNNFSRAIGLYENAAAKNPTNFIFWRSLGDAQYREKNYPEAMVAYQIAFGINEIDTLTLMGLSLSYLHLNNYQNAGETLERYIKLNTQNATAYANLSLVYTQLENFQKGKEFAEKALNIDKTNGAAWNSLGNFYLFTKDFMEAKKCFQEGLKHRPYDSVLQLNLAKANSLSN